MSKGSLHDNNLLMDQKSSSKLKQEHESKQMNGKQNKVANGGGSKLHIIDKGPPWWRSQRYILAYLIFGALMNIFFQRINFSIAIICMVNHTAIARHNHALLGSNQSSHDYDSRDTLVLSSNQSLHQISTPHDSLLGNSNIPFHDHEYIDLDNTSILLQDNGSVYLDTSYSVSPISVLAMERKHSSSGEVGGGRTTSSTGNKVSGNSSEATEESADRCGAGHLTSQEEKEDGPFVWNKEMQGILLGAVYWTYLVVQVPGNHLVRKIKKKTVTLLSMALMTLMTMLMHVAALWSPWAVFAVKLVQGGCTALAVIAIYGMWGKWAPPSERTSLISFGMSGQMLGNVIVFPVSAVLCKYGFLGGWPSVFYVFGMVGMVWMALFFFLSDESPSTHRFITEEEKIYIQSSLSQNTVDKEQPKTPWVAILTSPAFWGIVFAHVSFTWGLFLLLSTLPQYMYEVLKFDIKSNGVFTMLPYLALVFTTQAAGRISDFLIRRKILKVAWTRKLCIIIANMVPAVLLAGMSFLDCTQPELVITLLVIGVAATGFGLCGFIVNPYDIAPRFATMIMAVSNSLATIPGILTPYVVAAMTKQQSREQWQMVFFLTSGIFVVGTLGFCLLARGEVQAWALEEHDDVRIGAEVEEETEERKNEECESMLEKV